jgi:hypothetical protein
MLDSPVQPESDVGLRTSRGGHLLADYPVNGSVQMTQLCEPDNTGYPLCSHQY